VPDERVWGFRGRVSTSDQNPQFVFKKSPWDSSPTQFSNIGASPAPPTVFKYWDSYLPMQHSHALHTRTMPTAVAAHPLVFAAITVCGLAGLGIAAWGVWCMVRDSRKY